MLAKQLSVFIENKPGRLSEITEKLAELEINMTALSIADTTDFGILRMIVDDPEESHKKLLASGFTVTSNTVLVLRISNVPGGLTSLLKALAQGGVMIEYVYAFADSESYAYAVIRTDDTPLAEQILAQNGFLD